MPASGSVPGPELLLTPARKNGRKKGGGGGGGGKKPTKLPPGALLQLVPVSHGVRVSPVHPGGPMTLTHARQHPHSDAARRILLKRYRWKPSDPPLAILALQRREPEQVYNKRAAVARTTHPTVRLRGEASSVWESAEGQTGG